MVGVMKIIQDMFVNICILVSIIFIISQVFKNVDILDLKTKFVYKVALGVLGGILGVALMFYGIRITPSLVIDFRHISEVVIAIYGGLFSVFVTSIISAIFRLFYFGISNYSIITSVGIIIVSVGCGIISTLTIGNKQKWIYMLTYSVIVRSIILSLLLKDISLIKLVLILFFIGTLAVGSLVYYLVEYLETSNRVLKKLKYEASKDSLTGLNNVRNFNRLLNEAIKNAEQKNESLSVLLVDIDFFKKVNDTYGHPAGDSVLRNLAYILLGACSKFDIVGRIGGEEFSVILPRCNGNKAIEIAERIRAVVEKYPFVLPEGKTIYVTVSIGVASYQSITRETQNILKCADLALYNAKHTGRNKVSFENK